MAEDSRPPGRPPLRRGDPSVSIHIRVPASQYDRLYQQARAARDDSVPALIRRRLDADEDEDDE